MRSLRFYIQLSFDGNGKNRVFFKNMDKQCAIIFRLKKRNMLCKASELYPGLDIEGGS